MQKKKKDVQPFRQKALLLPPFKGCASLGLTAPVLFLSPHCSPISSSLCPPCLPACSPAPCPSPAVTLTASSLVCFSPESPLWPKENLDPVVVQEGAPLTLQCNPPPGLPSPVIFWMSSCKSCFISVLILGGIPWGGVFPGLKDLDS